MLICFEGIAGGGKTTQASLLSNYLKNNLNKEVFISSAYEGNRRKIAAEFINASGVSASAEAIIFTFQALHAAQYQEVVTALEGNKIAIADRWRYSFFAHHLNKTTFGDRIDFMRELDQFAYHSLEPDITFLLDLDSAIAYQRYFDRENIINDQGLPLMDKAYFDAVTKYYQEIAKTKGWYVIDAARTKEEVSKSIIAIIDQTI